MENNKLNIRRRDFLEIICISIVIIIFFLFEFEIRDIIVDEVLLKKVEFTGALFLIGLLHMLASNILSQLYNLQRIIMPSSFKGPLATPRRLKIIGAVLLAISLIGGLLLLAKRR